MAQGLKSLAKDTAVYGLSSMLGRFLNWCLVPLYTHVFDADQYGVVTLVYSVVALLLVLLTYGMETGFFRFANHERWPDPMQVYTTALTALTISGAVFIAIVFAGLGTWASWLDCGAHPSFVSIMGITVAVDAFTCLPFAYLRYKRRSLRFASLKLIGIGLNIFFNIFFILLLPHLASWNIVAWMWMPDFGIGYIFLSNLLSTLITLLLLLPELKVRWSFSAPLLREMLAYSLPLLVLGLAGIMNQTIDKILYPLLVPDHAEAMEGLGIYGANYKIAIIMVMFLQAFRFAYEPFVFAKNAESKAEGHAAYRKAMKWFIIFAMFIFLGVMMMLDIVKWFVAPAYFSGLKVVPVVMFAEVCFGIFFNLSVWYKITDRTVWGSWFSVLGLAVTIGLNAWFVPMWGYMGCAWAALGCYGVMMLSSWAVGRVKHPISYDLSSALFYILAALALWIGATAIVEHCSLSLIASWAVKIGAVVLYILAVALKERFIIIPRPQRAA